MLFVNERIGVIDLAMNPRNPEVLYAAAFEKQRLPWQMVNGGPESGIYKSADGGRTWTRFAGGSLDAVDCAQTGACWGSGAAGRVARLRVDR